MYKLVIFDFDGVLADSAAWFTGELPGLTEEFGLNPLDAAEIERLRGCDTREILKALHVPAWKLPAIAGRLRQRFAEDIDQVKLFPGAKVLLRRLACHGVTLGVVSSNSEANVRRILGPEAAALIGLFECGVSLFGKASRFRRIVKRARIDAALTLCLGDEARDIEAARSAGLACGAATWGYATRELLLSKAPTWLFETPEAVAERLAA